MEQNIEIQDYYSGSERRFFKYTMISLLTGLLMPLISKTGSTFSTYISLFSTLFAFWAVWLYLFKISTDRLSYSLKFFGFTILYMIAVGIIGGSLHAGRTTIMISITQDYRYVCLFFLGGIYAENERYMNYYDRIVRIIAYISFVMALIAAILIGLSGNIIARGAEDQTSYHLWWASACCFAYCGLYAFLSDDNKRNKRTSLLAFISYFVIGMSFLKRSCFLNSIFIILLALFLSKKKGNNHNNVLITIVLIALIIMVVLALIPSVSDTVFAALFDRFSNTANNMEKFDRLVEWEVYKKQSSLFQRIMGFGIGNYPIYVRYGIGNEESLLNALHFGYANIFFKGGILYAIFYISTYLKVFKNWFNCKRYTTRYLICFGVSISAFISLFYEGSWTYTILPFFISTSIFYAARYDDN